MKTIWKIGIIASLLVVVLAFTGFAYAGSTGVGMRDLLSGNFTMNGFSGMHAGDMPMMGYGGGMLHEYMDEAWAQLLGLTADEIADKLAQGLTHYDIALEQGKTAEEFEGLMKAAMTIAVAAAVQDGAITQEQADAMLQHMNSMPHSGMGAGGMHERMNGPAEGGLPGAGFMGMHGGPGMFGLSGGRFAALAEFTGLSTDEIQDRIGAGETLADILSSAGRSLEEWTAEVLDVHSQRINEAVENGEITREQADAMLQRLQERVENGWGEPFGPMGPLSEPGGFGPGMHGPGDHGGHHGPNR